MRRLRRFLPDEIYFVTIRTVEERFALDAYACPGAWQEADGKQLDFAAKQAMRERGRACIEATEALTEAIFLSEKAPKVPRPNVPYTTFTDSIRNIIGSCMARGIAMFGVHPKKVPTTFFQNLHQTTQLASRSFDGWKCDDYAVFSPTKSTS